MHSDRGGVQFFVHRQIVSIVMDIFSFVYYIVSLKNELSTRVNMACFTL